MALLVDGPIATVDLLTEYDSNVLGVAAAEGINLTTKLLRSHDLMLTELERLTQRPSELWDAVWWSPLIRIDCIVWSRALRDWQVQEALALIYRDAYFSQLNDRHRARAEEYAVLANAARRNAIQAGFDLVQVPLRRPEAPSITLVAASELGGTFYFVVSHSNDVGDESSPSRLTSVDVSDGEAADISLSLPAAPNATSWNLYAGTAPDQLFRQNPDPIAIGLDCLFTPSTSTTGGIKPTDGQKATHHRPFLQTQLRG